MLSNITVSILARQPVCTPACMSDVMLRLDSIQHWHSAGASDDFISSHSANTFLGGDRRRLHNTNANQTVFKYF